MTLPLLFIWGSPAIYSGNPVEMDKKLFQGRWKITSQIENGEPTKDPPDFIFSGDMLSLKQGDKVLVSKFKLDHTKSPKTIDINILGELYLGIYEIKGDEMRLCVGLAKVARPKKFDSPPGGHRNLTTLKRAKD